METKKLIKNDGYYMPLFNLKGLKSAISPFFGGDIKLDQHRYALQPTTELDLYNNIFSRNVVFDIEGGLYFLNGQTDMQQNDVLEYKADLLYQNVLRSNPRFTIDTTSYVALGNNVELHKIVLRNISKKRFSLKTTIAIPIYARSADNLRDHRHVTSLLNQIETTDCGVLVKPTLSFDERGHRLNETIYSVFSSSPDLAIKGSIPTLDKYIDGGSLSFPKGLDNVVSKETVINGYEAMGGIQFEKTNVKPNEQVTFYVSIGISTNKQEAIDHGTKYLSPLPFTKGLEEVKTFFANYTSKLKFNIANKETNNQLTWVVLQPMLRRYFGNSYLPHHDYGKGGKGWRDLWQDLLALVMMNDEGVNKLLYNNFSGIRIDGSNATIINDETGGFKADRNSITRVWSDHGAWPLLTAKMYIDETGDIEFLLKEQQYFNDKFTHYTKKTKKEPSDSVLQDSKGRIYKGTILEHLLLQNIVGYYNIGVNGFLKLEDADWNDGLDMAKQNGESVAFTHMYADNLRVLAKLIANLPCQKITLFQELLPLLEVNANLKSYFDSVSKFSGSKVDINKEEVVDKLNRLSSKRVDFLQRKAFRNDNFQSYFNNDRIDLDEGGTVSLTGQAMALLSQTATNDQARAIAKKTKATLFNKEIGGYHLNNNYKKVLTNMGRAYGFAYGNKENGAIFSHMVLMYAYGLYQYGLVNYARQAVFTILEQAQKQESSVPAGIPEYFTEKGKGKYPYLTGSASWMLKILRTEVFGIHMRLGKLKLSPKLSKKDFIKGKASIQTYLFSEMRTVTYYNEQELDYGAYDILKIEVNKEVKENEFSSLDGDIDIYLGAKN